MQHRLLDTNTGSDRRERAGKGLLLSAYVHVVSTSLQTGWSTVCVGAENTLHQMQRQTISISACKMTVRSGCTYNVQQFSRRLSGCVL